MTVCDYCLCDARALFFIASQPTRGQMVQAGDELGNARVRAEDKAEQVDENSESDGRRQEGEVVATCACLSLVDCWPAARAGVV